MESIEFVNRYELYLDEIGEVIKPELLPNIDEIRQIDPHDLVRPEGYYQSLTIYFVGELRNFSLKIFPE